MIKLIMVFLKSTKNTHVYKNDEPGAAVPTLYIQRDALPNKPQKIEISIREVE